MNWERDDHGDPIIVVPDGGAVCDECGELYQPKPDYRWNPTNPLCDGCWQTIDEGMHGRRFAITCALMDRETGGGLMARMSDERFERYVASQVRQFNEWRNKRG